MDEPDGNLRPEETEATTETEAPPEVGTLKPMDVLVGEMLAGTWGRGQQRKRRLEAAGYDAAEADAAYRKAIRHQK